MRLHPLANRVQKWDGAPRDVNLDGYCSTGAELVVCSANAEQPQRCRHAARSEPQELNAAAEMRVPKSFLLLGIRIRLMRTF